MFQPTLSIIRRFSNTVGKLEGHCRNHGAAPHFVKLQIYFLPNEELHKPGFTAEARHIRLLHSIQTDSSAHPASYPVGTKEFVLSG
jgi:hypothetical protein